MPRRRSCSPSSPSGIASAISPTRNVAVGITERIRSSAAARAGPPPSQRPLRAAATRARRSPSRCRHRGSTLPRLYAGATNRTPEHVAPDANIHPLRRRSENRATPPPRSRHSRGASPPSSSLRRRRREGLSGHRCRASPGSLDHSDERLSAELPAAAGLAIECPAGGTVPDIGAVESDRRANRDRPRLVPGLSTAPSASSTRCARGLFAAEREPDIFTFPAARELIRPSSRRGSCRSRGSPGSRASARSAATPGAGATSSRTCRATSRSLDLDALRRSSSSSSHACAVNVAPAPEAP